MNEFQEAFLEENINKLEEQIIDNIIGEDQEYLAAHVYIRPKSHHDYVAKKVCRLQLHFKNEDLNNPEKMTRIKRTAEYRVHNTFPLDILHKAGIIFKLHQPKMFYISDKNVNHTIFMGENKFENNPPIKMSVNKQTKAIQYHCQIHFYISQPDDKIIQARQRREDIMENRFIKKINNLKYRPSSQDFTTFNQLADEFRKYRNEYPPSTRLPSPPSPSDTTTPRNQTRQSRTQPPSPEEQSPPLSTKSLPPTYPPGHPKYNRNQKPRHKNTTANKKSN